MGTAYLPTYSSAPQRVEYSTASAFSFSGRSELTAGSQHFLKPLQTAGQGDPWKQLCSLFTDPRRTPGRYFSNAVHLNRTADAMFHVDSVDRASQDCPTRRALAPRWRLVENPNLVPPNDAYDPQAILALSHAGCRINQLKGVMQSQAYSVLSSAT